MPPWRAGRIYCPDVIPRRAKIICDADLVVDAALFRVPQDHGAALVDLELLAVFRRCVIDGGNPPQGDREDALIDQFNVNELFVEAHRVNGCFFWESVFINWTLAFLKKDRAAQGALWYGKSTQNYYRPQESLCQPHPLKL